MIAIEVDVDDDQARALWVAVSGLVEQLPDDWVLIGGLMVQIHALEHGLGDVRVTNDIDVLGQARPQGTLQRIDRALRDDGFELQGPDFDGYAQRYERAGLIVDVLAPDGIKPPPSLRQGVKAIGVPGGKQALERSETVRVTVDDTAFELRRPTLLGAILIKARSLMVHGDPGSQREDLLRLLALVDDPRAIAPELRKTERKWLRTAEERLAFSAPASLDAATVRRASQAYRLLLAT
jgi:hypothetical protein